MRLAFLVTLLLPTPALAADHYLTDRFAGGHMRGRLVFGTDHSAGTTRADVAPSGLVALVDDSASLAAVVAEVKSDAGTESVRLVETDAWLHGAATLTSLPKADAKVAITLYDTLSSPVATLSGTLTTKGALTLAVDTGSKRAADVSLLASGLYGAASSYDLVLELAGADIYDVAYASVALTGSGVSTKAEVDWNAAGSVWEGSLTLDHSGVVKTELQSQDSGGKKLDTAKMDLGAPWLDGGEGVATFPTDDDPLTSVGLLRPRGLGGTVTQMASAIQYGETGYRLAVVSDGWTLGDTLPTQAQLTLTDGQTVTVGANSYQRRALRSPKLGSLCTLSGVIRGSGATGGLQLNGKRVGIGGDSRLQFEDLLAPVCVEGTCVQLVEDDDGACAVSVSQYRWDTRFKADDVAVALTLSDAAGVEVDSIDFTATFDDEVTVVFATTLGLSGDPEGGVLSGKLSLLGPANSKGKQSTLSKGKFTALATTDGDGGVDLGGAAKDETALRTSFAVLLGTSGSTCGDDKSGYTSVPPLAAATGNGSGTKNASSTTSAKPQLL